MPVRILSAQAQTTSTKASEPPAEIAAIGELGENIYDFAKDQRWTKAADKLPSLKKEGKSLRSIIRGSTQVSDELDNTIAALETSIGQKDRQATMLDANRVTLIAANLAEPFHPKIPSDITRLDYYGRELETWSAAKNAEKLKQAADGLEKTWGRVRPAITEHGGATQAKAFDDLVAKLKMAQSPMHYGQLATPILDEVDNLETVFAK